MLGAVAFSRAHFGQGIGPVLFSNVQCDGTETTLIECPWTAHNTHLCHHSEDAGVMCQGISIRNDVWYLFFFVLLALHRTLYTWVGSCCWCQF